MASRGSHQLAFVSKVILAGASPILSVHYDGGRWWILAEGDLPRPREESLQAAPIAEVIDVLGPELGRGMDAARQEAESSPRQVGFAVWWQDDWLTGQAALDVLDELDPHYEPE